MRQNTDTGLLPKTLTRWSGLASIYNTGTLPVLSYNVNSVALIYTGIQLAAVVTLDHLFKVQRTNL